MQAEMTSEGTRVSEEVLSDENSSVRAPNIDVTNAGPSGNCNQIYLFNKARLSKVQYQIDVILIS
jgi:hypothetical protein